MHCLRCHGLMVTLRLEDVGSSSLCFSGWQCLMCGEVIDSVIIANRKELHGPTGSRGRIRYGVSLGQGGLPQGDENLTPTLVQGTPSHERPHRNSVHKRRIR